MIVNRSHFDGSLGLDEPAAQHGVYMAVAQVSVGLHDFTLHLLLQQEAPQTPVKKTPSILPVQDILENM